MLRDVVNMGDRNVIKRESETILKYDNITLETQRMWNVKTKVIPLTTVVKGTISESFRKYMCNLPGKHEIKVLQKQPYGALHTYCGTY